MSEPLHCYHCDRTQPVAQLGWMTVQYENIPDYAPRFCGPSCLHAWGTAGMNRLTNAILGIRADDARQEALGAGSEGEDGVNPWNSEGVRAAIKMHREYRGRLMDRENAQDIWNTWIGADYTPEQAVAEARERGMPLAEMAAELVICAAEAHGVALTDTYDPDALTAVFLQVLERAAANQARALVPPIGGGKPRLGPRPSASDDP